MGQPIGTIVAFGISDFVPKGYIACEGQVVKTAQLPDLFAAIGYSFGKKDNDFLLPDLRGAAVKGAGQGGGLPFYLVGQSGGAEKVTLTEDHLPTHTHPVEVALKCSDTAGSASPVSNYPAKLADLGKKVYVSAVGTVFLGAPLITLDTYGGNASISILNPCLPLRYCIKYNPHEPG